MTLARMARTRPPHFQRIWNVSYGLSKQGEFIRLHQTEFIL
jgi:hypothetical protein